MRLSITHAWKQANWLDDPACTANNPAAMRSYAEDPRMLNRLFALALVGAVVACSGPVPAQADTLVAGKDYVELPQAQPTTSGDKIEVVEVFGYWCIHCAHLDPTIAAWKAKQPEDVAVSYVPAVFSGGIEEVFARAFYTAETMGLLDKTHTLMFTKAAVERSVRTPDDIIQVYVDAGVSKADFEATMGSFAVNAKIARTKQTLPRYQIEGTPTLIVAGKYKISVTREGGFERMLQVADQLIARERAAKKAS